jgi:UbiD family decarboxylase
VRIERCRVGRCSRWSTAEALTLQRCCRFRRIPLYLDELGIAGALHGAPIKVVKCRTRDVRGPAEAAIVIEGRILLDAREEEEGPFGSSRVT